MNWTVILQGAQLLVLLGFWLYVWKVKDQLIALKDATIEQQQKQIKALEAERAPAIARELETMRKAAEQFADEKQRVEAQLTPATQHALRMGALGGLLEGFATLHDSLHPDIFFSPRAAEKHSSAMEHLKALITTVLKGEFPKFPKADELIKRSEKYLKPQ